MKTERIKTRHKGKFAKPIALGPAGSTGKGRKRNTNWRAASNGSLATRTHLHNAHGSITRSATRSMAATRNVNWKAGSSAARQTLHAHPRATKAAGTALVATAAYKGGKAYYKRRLKKKWQGRHPVTIGRTTLTGSLHRPIGKHTQADVHYSVIRQPTLHKVVGGKNVAKGVPLSKSSHGGAHHTTTQPRDNHGRFASKGGFT
jgi:hypothetical protein